jgi:hypothetical protein
VDGIEDYSSREKTPRENQRDEGTAEVIFIK